MKINEEFKALIPPLSEEEYSQLEKSIATEGCRDALVTWRGTLIDGHNRHEICVNGGFEFTTVEREFDNAELAKIWIIDNQAGRRNISGFVRAELQLHKKKFLAAIAKTNQKKAGKDFGRGTEKLSQNSVKAIPADTQKDLAKAAGVSHDTIHKVETIKKTAGDKLLEAVRHGDVSVNAAAEIATLPVEAQERVVVGGKDATLIAAKEIRVAKAAVRKQENDKLKAESRAIPLPEGKYRTIVIDPPWEMKKIARDVAPDQVDFDYPTMSLDEIRDFPVADMAHDECIVYCWTTQKLLPETFGIIEAWGFQYLATMTWHKNGGFQPFGLPQYNSEFVLIGRKGGASFDDTKQFFLCNSWKRREHSRKPDEFYDLVGRVSPSPRIDVFSRERRDGFDQFGNQTENF